MAPALIPVIVMPLLVAAWVFRKARLPSSRTLHVPASVTLVSASRGDNASEAPSPAQARPPVPDARFVQAEALDASQTAALLASLQTLPHPPRALHQLVSTDFLDRASSVELNELVMSEPLVAARVLAAVNAPLYGLQRPVTSIGQAVTFLGLSTVRGLCLQQLLLETLPAGNAELRHEFDTLARASAIAGELCLQLARRLDQHDVAAMSTQLVLSFLGRFATAVLMQRQGTVAPTDEHVARTLAEQQALGLGASEIGYLLLRDWGLPPSIGLATREIGSVLFMEAPANSLTPATPQALRCLCAILGERIARGALDRLAAYDVAHDPSDDVQVLRGHLPTWLQNQITDALRAPEMARLQH